MPFAPRIRKQLLSALNEHIIPLLQTQTVAQVLVAPPFYFTGVELSIEQKELLPDKKSNPLQMVSEWKKEQLGGRRLTLLGIHYSGTALERVGVTRGMAADLKARGLPVPPGISSFRAVSPCAVYVPSHIPQSGQSLTGEGLHRVVLIWFTEREVWISHHNSKEGGVHQLSISDPALQQMRADYARALEHRNFHAAQTILLNLMQAVSRYLSSHTVTVSNSAWPAFEEIPALIPPHVSARNTQYCYKIMDYIQLHLNTPLSLEVLAKVIGVTVPHLCSIFRKSTGMTLMRYITLHRLRAAEMMLVKTPERISDIAQLTGFAGSHSFAGAFKRHFGMSAREYRRKNAER